MRYITPIKPFLKNNCPYWKTVHRVAGIVALVSKKVLRRYTVEWNVSI